MQKNLLIILLALSALAVPAQVPLATHIQILKAEDARRYDAVLERLMRSPSPAVRARAALAAGRIGNVKAIPALADLLEKDLDDDVRAMAAFALGEIESVEAAAVIIKALASDTRPVSASGVPSVSPKPAKVTARLIEAAGKIAGANSKHPSARTLGRAIVEEVDIQARPGSAQDRTILLLGLTAILRARPEGGESTAEELLTSKDARIRADAGNTLARLRSKTAGPSLVDLLERDKDPVARANAARALGAAEDQNVLPLLLKVATTDVDPRVRISALRSAGALKDRKAAAPMIERGRALLAAMGVAQKASPSAARLPDEINELLEIAGALARVLPNSENDDAVRFLRDLRLKTDGMYSEVETAFARIAPEAYVAATMPAGFGYRSPRQATAYAQGLAAIAETKNSSLIAQAGKMLTAWIAGMKSGVKPADQGRMLTAMPDITTALAALKPDNLNVILLGQLQNEDPFVRAAAAGALAELPPSPENVVALTKASIRARLTDKHDNDAKIAILDALEKLDRRAAVAEYLSALADPDYLIRKKAFAFLADPSVQKDFPGVPSMLDSARAERRDEVGRYSPVSGTRLGQVLNSDADYRRALSRKNGSVKAVLTTEKGAFTIDFFPEDAPLTVDNFIKLARTGYFNGLEVHRVVPNFVMQDGDPRGDGNGGPGWSIRCEINMREYERGAVGMALSGKDTGGSQWFVTHSPQPHLDGGYTVFGRVDESGMRVVDRIVRGDRILSVRIVGR